MTLKRREFSKWMGTAACVGMSGALAAGYPDRPVRIVVAWPGGGLVDIPARHVADHLQKALGQPFVVENKAGAGGSIGAGLVAKAPPDGYTLLVTTSAIAINRALGMPAPFDLFKSFEPVASLAHAPLILVTHPGLKVDSVAQLIELGRDKSRQLSYASAGNGSPGHLAAEWFKAATGVHAVHVPYKGAPSAMVDQISGQVDFHFANAAVALPQIQAGKIRALAVASASRARLLPEVPTMIEAGLKEFDTDQWIGLLAPRGTPAAVLDLLGTHIRRSFVGEAIGVSFARSGLSMAKSQNAASFAKEIRADAQRWESVVRQTGIKAE